MRSGSAWAEGFSVTKRIPSRIDSMDIIRQQADEIARPRERVERLEVDLELARNDRPGPKPPSWLKTNSPERKGPKRPRKKRPKGFARKRSIADRQVMHAVVRCPSRECVLQGGTVDGDVERNGEPIVSRWTAEHTSWGDHLSVTPVDLVLPPTSSLPIDDQHRMLRLLYRR